MRQPTRARGYSRLGASDAYHVLFFGLDLFRDTLSRRSDPVFGEAATPDSPLTLLRGGDISPWPPGSRAAASWGLAPTGTRGSSGGIGRSCGSRLCCRFSPDDDKMFQGR